MRVETIDTAGVPAGVSIHEPHPECNCGVALLYFHGGGLLYGERDDLPAPYLDMIAEHGYTLYCFDYPLAPEAPLNRVLAGVLDAWRWFVEGDYSRKPFEAYALFGRSAGAYLALMLAARIRRETDGPQPYAVVDFYGFDTVADRFFAEIPASFRALPAVGSTCLERLQGGEPVTSGPKAQRFSLYVHVRQAGTWQDALGIAEGEEARFSCSDEDSATFPPLFIASSTTDEDVPYRVPKSLFRKAPHARMKTVYGLEHDFDRDTSNPAGRETYAEMLTWLNKVAKPSR